MLEKEAQTADREYKVNKKMDRINRYNQTRGGGHESGHTALNFDPQGGSGVFDMGMGGDAFSFDMSGGGLFDTSMGFGDSPRPKRRRKNKKSKKGNGKDIHIHLK